MVNETILETIEVDETTGHTTARVRQQFADGSARDVTQMTDRDGGVWTSYTTADGVPVEESPWGTAHLLGAYGQDGNWVEYSWDGPTMLHSVYGDAGYRKAAWSAPSGWTHPDSTGSELFTIQSSRAGTPEQIRVSDTVDGGAVATYEMGGTTHTERIGVQEIPNIDGTLTRRYLLPDGYTESFTFDAADRPVFHQSSTDVVEPTTWQTVPGNVGYHGGVVGEQELEANADGTTQVRLTYGDGTTRDVVGQVGEGTVPDTYVTPEGNNATAYDDGDLGYYQERRPDGTTALYREWSGQAMSEVVWPGGEEARIETDWDAALPADGEWGVGTTLFRVIENGGTQWRVTAAADGGAMAHVQNGEESQFVRVDLAEVQNADGSLTRVFTFPDGRTEAFTFDAAGRPVFHEVHPGSGEMPAALDRGATANGGYHGGLVRREVVEVEEPGRETVRDTYADGTVRDGLHSHDLLVDMYTYPDGTRVSEVAFGAANSTTTDPGGVATERTWGPDHLQEVVRDPAGVVVASTMWGGTSQVGDAVFSTQQTVDGILTGTSVSEGVDGAASATITTGDVSRTVPLEVAEFENANGTVTKVFTFPDGRTEAFTTDASGAVVYHEAHPGTGVFADSQVDPADADDHHGGVIREEILGTREDGAVTLERTFADGTVLDVLRVSANPDDPSVTAVFDSWTEADGTRVLSRVDGGETEWSSAVDPRGGDIVQRDWDAHGRLDESSVNGDGVTTRARVNSGSDPEPGDTILTTTQTAATGAVVQTTVLATADGGAVATAVRGDGSAVTARLAVREVDNPDGTRTRMFTFPDGRVESVTYDTDGRPVGYEGIADQDDHAGARLTPSRGRAVAPRP